MSEPTFMAINSSSDGYQRAVALAHEGLGLFKEKCKVKADSDLACVKIWLPEQNGGEAGAYVWLMNAWFDDGFCFAAPFELPAAFSSWEEGKYIRFSEDQIVDWYLLSQCGEMLGGYTIRYQRSLVPEDKRDEFDAYVGVKKYL